LLSSPTPKHRPPLLVCAGKPIRMGYSLQEAAWLPNVRPHLRSDAVSIWARKPMYTLPLLKAASILRHTVAFPLVPLMQALLPVSARWAWSRLPDTTAFVAALLAYVHGPAHCASSVPFASRLPVV